MVTVVSVSAVNVADYDAVIFIGGSGASVYFDDETVLSIAKQAHQQNKVIGAICIAPALLAKANVLQGKRATVWSSSMDKSPIKMLEQGGATYEDKPVVVDGKIITAQGPSAAKEFAEAVISIISNQ